MSLYQDFIKNYLKEAENNENLQKVRNFIATGKVDGKFSDLLNKLSDEDFKSIFDKNFKNYFVNKHKFAFNIGKEQPYLIDFIEDRHDSEKKPVIDEMIAIFNNKIEGDGIKKFKAASGITIEQFADIINIGEDIEEAQANIDKLDKLFKQAVTAEVEKRLAGNAPKGNGSNITGEVTKEQFKNMSLSQQAALYKDNKELYLKLIN